MARFVGTGKDPRYPKGVVVDIPDGSDLYNGVGNLSELDLVEKGFVKPADPYADPGRTPSNIAAAVIRGDTLSDPYDAAVAVKEGLVDEQGRPSARAYDLVHEEPQDVAESGRGEAGGPARGVISAFAANQRDGLPKGGGAKPADADVATPDVGDAGSYEDAGSQADASGTGSANVEAEPDSGGSEPKSSSRGSSK